MRKADVLVGETYIAKVCNALVPVRLESTSIFGGWNGRNLKTGRPIRVKSAQRLRGLAPGELRAAQEGRLLVPAGRLP